MTSFLDPYLKGDYTFIRGEPRGLLLNVKQTVFWQQSEHYAANYGC